MRPSYEQSSDLAAIRGHYEATRHMEPEVRAAATRPENRSRMWGEEGATHVYDDAFIQAIVDGETAYAELVDDLGDFLDSGDGTGELTNDTDLSHTLATSAVEEASRAATAALEEFEATVAYAYHVSRLSYGQLANLTNKSKSTIADIVKRARHLEVLTPEASEGEES